MRNPTITHPQIESLGARIVRLASQARLVTPPPRSNERNARREPRRGEHEYVRDRSKALAVIRERAETRAELAQKLGRIEGAVIGFQIFHATVAPKPAAHHTGVRVVGGGDWPETARALERVERPPKRRGRPGRRGRLVAALARSRTA